MSNFIKLQKGLFAGVAEGRYTKCAYLYHFLKSSLFLLLLMYFAKTMKSCLKKLNLKTKHVSRSWRVSIRKILKIAVTFKLKLEDYIVPRLFGTGRKKVFPWHVQLTYWAIIWCFTDSLFYHGQLLNASSTRINLTKYYVGTVGKLGRSIWWYNNTRSVFGVVNVTET